MVRSEDPYTVAARKYVPKTTKFLFVAEAPPLDPCRYFYYEHVTEGDWLWIALMKALYPAEWTDTKTERGRKESWLLRFRNDQFRLIDGVKVPINGSSQARIRLIEADSAELLAEIRDIGPRAIVLIKVTVHKALYQKLKDAHLLVVNAKPLPFPSSGRQKEFHKNFRSFLKAHLELR